MKVKHRDAIKQIIIDLCAYNVKLIKIKFLLRIKGELVFHELMANLFWNTNIVQVTRI